MFKLNLSVVDESDFMHIFSYGYIEIQSNNTTIRSNNPGMIFLYITDIIIGICGLLEKPYWQVCKFEMPASSFNFVLKWKYKNPNYIELFYEGKKINSHQTNELLDSFKVEISRFIDEYGKRLTCEAEYEDIKFYLLKSVEEFNKFTFPRK